MQNDINNIYKRNEEDLKNELSVFKEQNVDYNKKYKNIEKQVQDLRKENDSLYKFKSNYSDNEIEIIELKNKLRKFENLNNKYESLKFNYDELVKQRIN